MAKSVIIKSSKIRNSKLSLDEIIEKISALEPINNDREIILCMAHEIKKIKTFLDIN